MFDTNWGGWSVRSGAVHVNFLEKYDEILTTQF